MSMKMSRRARRMEKQHKRRKGVPGLNIVSLMDIFTILVFFLLVNQSGIQPQGATITLPKSNVEKIPTETLIVTVSNQEIFLQGRKVADVSDALNENEILIPGLQQELQYQSDKGKVFGNQSAEEQKPVTIMGDKEIPYRLLKKIMLTCSQMGFSEVSLAVTRSNQQAGSS